jgi:hypothetical protein
MSGSQIAHRFDDLEGLSAGHQQQPFSVSVPVEAYPYSNDEDATAVHPTVAQLLGLEHWNDDGPE